jgi:LPXTG-motif cell wall-anchored protein
MGKRRLGVLIGAAVLTFAAVGSVSANAPTYTVEATKSATPDSVPAEGGDVTFTVQVHSTGTGGIATVQLTDDMVGCTFAGPTGDGGSIGTLDPDETWTYTCTVSNVAPDTKNTVTVDACHNSSPNCKQDEQKFETTADVTVGLCESDCALPSEQPSAQPTQGGGDASNLPTQAPTDTSVTGNTGPTDTAWFLVVGLAVLLGSLYVLRPAGARRER